MFVLALRNVFRHRARTAFTLSAIAFGVVGLVLSGGFVHDIFFQLGEAIIHSQTGHLQIAKAGYHEEGTRRPDQYLMEDASRVMSRVAAYPEVSDIMARIGFSGLLNNGRSDLAIVGEGLESDKEAKLGTYLTMVAGRQLAATDSNGALIGNGVARALKLSPGDPITVVVSTPGGATNTVDLEVIGVFQSFSKDYDARALKLNLATAQELLGTAGVNTIVVALHETTATAQVAQQLRTAFTKEGLEVRTWVELNDFYSKTVKLYDTQFGVLRLIVLLMVVLCVANSINMSVFERTAEFGTMRALGNRSSDVFYLVVTEACVLGVLGALCGVALSALLAWGISAIGIPMPPPPNADAGYIARIPLVGTVVAGAIAVGIGAAVIAGVVSAARVLRVSLVDSLRQAI